MLFTNISFLYYFLPVLIIIYFIMPKKIKNIILFLASMIFYFYGEPKYILLMILEILIAYIGGILIKKYKNKTYTEHIYMFKYTDIRRKILEYKFNDKAYYYKTISQVFLKNKKICEILKTYDIIIPVPIHNKRRKERGYNQSALIAKEFSKNINELEYEDILIKKKNTIAQSTLNKEERLKNAIDMYKIKENKQDIIYNKNVLIFDDIYTTGATANECAKAIRGANSNKIGVLTIAKD